MIDARCTILYKSTSTNGAHATNFYCIKIKQQRKENCFFFGTDIFCQKQRKIVYILQIFLIQMCISYKIIEHCMAVFVQEKKNQTEVFIICNKSWGAGGINFCECKEIEVIYFYFMKIKRFSIYQYRNSMPFLKLCIYIEYLAVYTLQLRTYTCTTIQNNACIHIKKARERLRNLNTMFPLTILFIQFSVTP